MLKDERFDLFAFALDREPPEWADRRQVAYERIRRRRDHDLTGDRTRLQPGGEIYSVTMSDVVAQFLAPDVAYQRGTRPASPEPSGQRRERGAAARLVRSRQQRSRLQRIG